MKELNKKTEVQENELLQDAHNLLESMTEKQAEDLIPYLTWILETPYSS